MIHRYLESYIRSDLKKKMVFISGPRQVGKTTLARQIGERFFNDQYEYLNWDFAEDRNKLLSGIWQAQRDLFILDEIHKYKNWKGYLKGVFDKFKERFSVLVTGSARLDIYRKGGDSLLGRYRSYRLHPLSVAEIDAPAGDRGKTFTPFKELQFPSGGGDSFQTLLKYGGFPEVFIKQEERTLRLWHNERADRLVKDDIRDVELVRDLSSLQVLIRLLPGKVGSLFSLNALREDLMAAHKSVALWVEILERFYYHFRIYPYQSTLVKSLRKEPKLYLWDWSEIEDPSIRFENMVAGHLLKFCHFLEDVHGFKAQLNFVRDKEQREVDFLVCVDGKPWFCIEAKYTSQEVPSSLKYFSTRLKVPFVYLVVQKSKVDVFKDSVRILSADKFLRGLV